MIIETERLWLRPFTWDDLPELLRIRQDEEVMRYLGGKAKQTREFTEQRMRFYLETRERYGFGPGPVILKSGGAVAGWGGLQPLENTGEVEIGYGFSKPYWGQGYATEMAAAWLRYGFETAGLARVVAVADPRNTGSWRVMEKLGMRHEKNAHHYGQECVFYAVSREEFKPREGFYAVREESKGGGEER
ncbi:MAG: GNAT family N-acetyltransferase [Acidobacteriota bacterium]|nr:GNAT family N-acetyltransferase [Acidobacteriota bacterium]